MISNLSISQIWQIAEWINLWGPDGIRRGGSLPPPNRQPEQRAVWQSGAACQAAPWLQSAKERDQIFFFLRRKPDVKARVVEIHDISERPRRPIVKIRSAARKPPQHRPLEASNIFPGARNESASGIGCSNRLERGLVLKSKNRKIAEVERAVGVADANVQRNRQRVIANTWRVVAGSARSRYRGGVQIVVEPGDTGNINLLRIKNGLASCNALSPGARLSEEVERKAGGVRPVVEKLENRGGERNI